MQKTVPIPELPTKHVVTHVVKANASFTDACHALRWKYRVIRTYIYRACKPDDLVGIDDEGYLATFDFDDGYGPFTPTLTDMLANDWTVLTVQFTRVGKSIFTGDNGSVFKQLLKQSPEEI